MFDKIVVTPKHTTEYVDRHIRIDRAPTDDSVRLLKEFEEKAESKFLERFTVESNTLNIVGVYFAGDLTGNGTLVVKFKLNDIEYKHNIPVTHKQMYGDRFDVLPGIFALISDVIAKELLSRYMDVFRWSPKS